jgi:hypothetical protein
VVVVALERYKAPLLDRVGLEGAVLGVQEVLRLEMELLALQIPEEEVAELMDHLLAQAAQA